LSLEQTAEAIGVSVGWTCQLRRRFIRQDGTVVSQRLSEENPLKRLRIRLRLRGSACKQLI
jgi:hypothetical protein